MALHASPAQRLARRKQETNNGQSAAPRRWDAWIWSHRHRLPQWHWRWRRHARPSTLRTADRIGDHLVARCLAFDRFRVRGGWPHGPKASRHALHTLDAAVDAHVQSVRAYEDERNPLLQLAQTGFVLRRIGELDRLLDVTAPSYAARESRRVADWRVAFRRERRDRMSRFQGLLADPIRLLEALGDEQQQLEVLMSLAHDFRRHGNDVYSDLERCVVSETYAACARLSKLAVGTTPEWFVPTHEARGVTSAEMELWTTLDAGQRAREASVWWELRHPNVLTLYGACHVGQEPVLVREQATCVLEMSREALPSWTGLLGVMRALQYVHQRRLVYDKLTLASFFWVDSQHTVALHGVGLRSEISTTASVASNVRDLGLCMLQLLEMRTRPLWKTPTVWETPVSRPDFVTNLQWSLVGRMCTQDPNSSVSLAYVVHQLDKWQPEVVGRHHSWDKSASSHATQESSSLEIAVAMPSFDPLLPAIDRLLSSPSRPVKIAVDEFVAGLEDENQREEAATLLAFEASKRRQRYTRVQLQLLELAATTIVGLPTFRRRVVVPNWFASRRELEVGGRLSAGSFGAVHRGSWAGVSVAIKCLFRCDREQFQREADVWFSLRHPHVVTLFGACHVGYPAVTSALDGPAPCPTRRPFFVCELCSQGSLSDYLRHQSPASRAQTCWTRLYEAALGLQHLHRRGVVHGDLKADNILVTADHRAKLADFGLSSAVRTSVKAKTSSGRAGPSGPVRWKAPERLGGRDDGPTVASDVYSLGMCVLEAASGRLPWHDVAEEAAVEYEVTHGRLPARPEGLDDRHWGLVRSMCRWKAEDRVTVDEVVVLLRSLA